MCANYIKFGNVTLTSLMKSYKDNRPINVDFYLRQFRRGVPGVKVIVKDINIVNNDMEFEFFLVESRCFISVKISDFRSNPLS